MPLVLHTLTDLADAGFDDIIDVRSPAEFAEDHLPGAINLPVLSNAERAEVGTIYKQVSPFDARKLGAALVAQNAARHLRETLADRPGSWRALVYCWRGGQRSGGFATILNQIGWRIETLEGGYRSWRRLVLAALDRPPPPIVLLDGNTGTAKTELLGHLARMDRQVVDLEHLACHRGSIFGGLGPQPGQKAFEGRLAHALASLDPSRPVIIEAESSAIGNCRLPAALWKAMQAAPRIVIEAQPPERARYLARTYAAMTEDPARLLDALDKLRAYQPKARLKDWAEMVEQQAFEALAAGLIKHHYDPAYARHRARSDVPALAVPAASLSEAALPALARTVSAAADALFCPRRTCP